MQIEVITIFPDLFHGFLTHGMVARARQRDRLRVRLTDLRAFTDDRHRTVDDRPYGGGPGMLLKPEPVYRALELLDAVASRPEDGRAREAPLVMLCPRGERLTQERLEQLARAPRLILLAGRYEGFDERIRTGFPWLPISIGDFVLSGGEVPAMVLIEGIARLLPGVLGHEESARRDSFSAWPGRDGLDHPHFTRPVCYRGAEVPEVLRSGDHGRIERWRRSRSRPAARAARGGRGNRVAKAARCDAGGAAQDRGQE